MISRQIVEQRLESFLAKAKESGTRITPQRLAIFKIVASSEEHPGAEEIHRKLRRKYAMISLDTVYRTLWLLEELGLVKVVEPHHESVRFDANISPHHHFTCLVCGSIRDFEDSRLDSIQIPVAVEDLGQPQSLRVEVQGICRDCLQKQENKNKNL